MDFTWYESHALDFRIWFTWLDKKMQSGSAQLKPYELGGCGSLGM